MTKDHWNARCVEYFRCHVGALNRPPSRADTSEDNPLGATLGRRADQV